MFRYSHNITEKQRGQAENETQEIDPAAAVQTGGGFFSKKQLNISDEIADKQVDVMMQILEVYEVYARQMKETDEKYQKHLSKSMNKFQKQGKTKKKGVRKWLMDVPTDRSERLQRARTRKNRRRKSEQTSTIQTKTEMLHQSGSTMPSSTSRARQIFLW